jgi:hypothetical protein
MLETPSIRRYWLSGPRSRVRPCAVTTRPVRAISRKGQVSSSGSSASSTARAVSRSRWCATPGASSAGKVQHEFSVTQAAPSRPALELLQQVFGCGHIIENRRHDNHHHDLLRFSVKRRRELVEVVVPFFEAYPLVTAKRADFEAFASVLHLMQAGAHLHEDGLRRIAAVTERMNRRARSRYLESSEAIRRPARSDAELKIWS